MTFRPIQRLESKPFGVQLVIIAMICDPLGAALGYALHPQLGVEPILGVAYGLVAASVPLSLWVLRHQMKHG